MKIIVFILACCTAIFGWKLYQAQNQLQALVLSSPKVAVIDWGDVMNVAHYNGSVTPQMGISRTNAVIKQLEAENYLVLDRAAAISCPENVRWNYDRIMNTSVNTDNLNGEKK